MKGTWTTTGGGGGGAGTVLGVIAVAVVAVAILGPVVRAAVSLLETVLIVAAVALVLALAGSGALLVWRLRHRGPSPAAVPWRAQALPPPARHLPAPHPPALEVPREVHLHLHGVSAEDVAAIIRDHQHP